MIWIYNTQLETLLVTQSIILCANRKRQIYCNDIFLKVALKWQWNQTVWAIYKTIFIFSMKCFKTDIQDFFFWQKIFKKKNLSIMKRKHFFARWWNSYHLWMIINHWISESVIKHMGQRASLPHQLHHAHPWTASVSAGRHRPFPLQPRVGTPDSLT